MEVNKKELLEQLVHGTKNSLPTLCKELVIYSLCSKYIENERPVRAINLMKRFLYWSVSKISLH